MSMLDKCTKVETGSFANLKALRVFEMFSLPKVVFMDVRGKKKFLYYTALLLRQVLANFGNVLNLTNKTNSFTNI